jgi:hypothetical protein
VGSLDRSYGKWQPNRQLAPLASAMMAAFPGAQYFIVAQHPDAEVSALIY